MKNQLYLFTMLISLTFISTDSSANLKDQDILLDSPAFKSSLRSDSKNTHGNVGQPLPVETDPPIPSLDPVRMGSSKVKVIKVSKRFEKGRIVGEQIFVCQFELLTPVYDAIDEGGLRAQNWTRSSHQFETSRLT